MVKKKILSIIFSLFVFLAVIAPCAIGASADPVSSYTPTDYYITKNYVAHSTSLPLTSSNNPYGFQFFVNPSPQIPRDYYAHWSYSFSFEPLLDLSQFNLTLTIGNPSSVTLDSYSLQRTQFGYTLDCYGHFTSSFSYQFGVTFVLDPLPSFSYKVTLLNCSFEWSTEEFSPPVDDDEFHTATASGYYYTFTPSVSSDYFPLKTFEDYPSPTDQSFSIAPSNSLKAYFGADIDYSDILTYHTIIQGSASFYCVNTNGFTGLDLLPSFQVLLSNVADPLASNYTSIDVSTLGLTRTPITGAWSYPVNNFTSRYTVSFYLILDGEALSPTYLSNYHYINIVFNSSVQRSTTVFFTPQDFSLSYFHRASSASPIPDNPYPDTVDTDENNYTQMTNAELKFLQSQLPTDKFSDIDDYINDLLSVQTGFSKQLFDDIYSNLSYSGTDFQFILPTATIPFPDAYHPLTLWSQQEIPFKYYIDNLPYVYRVIIGWLVIAGGCVAITFYVLHEIRELFSGNITPRV